MAVGWVVGMLFPSVSWMCLEPRNPPPSAEQRGQGGQREATTGQGTPRSTCRRVDHRRAELPQQTLVGRLLQILLSLVPSACLQPNDVQHVCVSFPSGLSGGPRSGARVLVSR